jgi:glycogen operon protein
MEDLFWSRPDGEPMTQADWDDVNNRVLCAELRMASGTPAYAEREDALFLVFNAGDDPVQVKVPEPPEGMRWCLRIRTFDPWFGSAPTNGDLEVPGPSVAICELEPRDG